MVVPAIKLIDQSTILPDLDFDWRVPVTPPAANAVDVTAEVEAAAEVTDLVVDAVLVVAERKRVRAASRIAMHRHSQTYHNTHTHNTHTHTRRIKTDAPATEAAEVAAVTPTVGWPVAGSMPA